MTSRIASMARRPLACALTLALMAPGAVLAQTAKEKELEARVAQLEAMVQTLMERQQAPVVAAPPPPPPPPSGPVTSAPAGVASTTQPKFPGTPGSGPVAQPVAVQPQNKPIQGITLTPGANPNTTIRFGGFLKADFLTTKTYDGALGEGAVGRLLYIPQQTPVGGKAGGIDTDFHAKFSRFNVGVDTITEDGNRMTGFIEMDFFGSDNVSNQINNLHGSTLRHAYLSWNNWLAGQTWSNFIDATNFPEAADILGPTDGVLFSRRAQIRYTKGGLSLSAENPETLTSAYNGGGATLASDRGGMPDLTVRYAWKGDWGSFGMAAIAREFATQTALTDDTAIGGAVTAGGKWILSPTNAISYQATYGKGIASYMGLGSGPDVEVDAQGDLHAIDTVAGWVGWNHKFTPTLRSTMMYSIVDMDRDIAHTGPLGTTRMQSLRANLFYSPLPKIDIGAEVMYGRRNVVSGASGDISRLQFTAKYSF